MATRNYLVTNHVEERKKLKQVWNNMRESKWWQTFHFGVNRPFKQVFQTQKKMFPKISSFVFEKPV